MLAFPTVNTTLQHLVSDKMRGRVMGIYITMFVGFFPIGNFAIGYISEFIGPASAIRVSMAIVLLACFVLYITRNKVEKLHAIHIEANALMMER